MSDLTSQYIIAQEEHDYNKKYEEGTIVKYTINDVVTAYTAKKSVPRFISILNKNYWKKIASTDEGGTVDYDNLKHKPTINGIELEGNITTKDLGINNKFKGWYTSSSTLPANPIVGDYAYVKGAESTDPATIYECTTAGTWSDSGRTADTSNVQTFASSQEVNEVHIVDDLITGGADDVLSAEQGKLLNDNKLSKTIEDDAFYVTDFNGYVICKIDADGVHAPNIQDNGGSIVIDNNKLLVTDANGYIVLRVDNNGIHSVVDKHAVACMVLSENYYPTSTPTRDSNGNVTHANVMFGTGVAGEIDITYTNGNASYVVVEYSLKQYAITINRDTNGNVTTVSVTEID